MVLESTIAKLRRKEQETGSKLARHKQPYSVMQITPTSLHQRNLNMAQRNLLWNQ